MFAAPPTPDLSDIYRMNADGTGTTRLTTDIGSQPDWQPLPVNTPSTYVRPQGPATPQYLPLVPAFASLHVPEQTARRRAHVRDPAPPPSHRSPDPDARRGGRQPRLLALGRLGPLDGPARRAGRSRRRRPRHPDLSITNVMRKSDLSDYTGELPPRPGCASPTA